MSHHNHDPPASRNGASTWKYDEQASFRMCYNRNCYKRFATAKGLALHISKEPNCRAFVSNNLATIKTSLVSRNVDSETNSHHLQNLKWYQTQRCRLNPNVATFLRRAPHIPPNNVLPLNQDQHTWVSPTTSVPEQEEPQDYAVILNDNEDDNCTSTTGSDVDNMPFVGATTMQQQEHPSPRIDQEAFNTIMERHKSRADDALLVLQRDPERSSIVELMHLLESLNCPDYALEKVLHWANKSKRNNFSFSPRAYTREANLQWIYKLLCNSHERLPFLQEVSLEGANEIQKVVCFDFGMSLLSLLQDEHLMQPQNLAINLENPTTLYQPPTNRLGDTNTGTRYRELYTEYITDPTRQLLAPIIMYMDGTAIDSKGRLEVCPVSFTCSLFRESARRHSESWRLLGYIPDLNRLRSNAMNAHANNKSRKGRTTRNLHKVLDVVMTGLVAAQNGKDKRLLNVPLKIAGNWISVDIICPLLFVINDGKQGDQLCARFNGHHRSTVRHHRSCNCHYEQLDNPDSKCEFLTTEEVNNLYLHGDEEELRKMSVYQVENSFNRLKMGSNPYGIYMCTPMDVMHGLQHGIIKYVLEVLMSNMNTSQKSLLDRLAITFNVSCKQSVRKYYPATDFSRGITNLTQITCSEYSGLLFLMLMLMLHDDAWHVMEDVFSDRLQAVVGTLETLVCFEEWLNQDEYWDLINESAEMLRAETAIKNLMHQIVTNLPRNEGSGWKLSKFHELLHIPRFMQAFGATKSYNAARPEAHHKQHAKVPGRRSQKRVHSIDQQCATRVTDSIVIETAYNLLFQTDVNYNDTPDSTMSHLQSETIEDAGTSSTYILHSFIDNNTTNLCYCVYDANDRRASISLEPNLEFFLMDYYKEDFDATGQGQLHLRTEFHRRQLPTSTSTMHDHANVCCDTLSLRCHPNYRGNGPWYDWIMIRFEDDNGVCNDYPSRIVACIPRQQGGLDQVSYELVVQCCEKPTKLQTTLFTEWIFCRDYYVVPASALVVPCLSAPACSDMSRVLIATDRHDWSFEFFNAADYVW